MVSVHAQSHNQYLVELLPGLLLMRSVATQMATKRKDERCDF